MLEIVKKLFHKIFKNMFHKEKKQNKYRYCAICYSVLTGKSNQRFCSESCKKKSKYQRQKKSKNQNPNF